MDVLQFWLRGAGIVILAMVLLTHHSESRKAEDYHTADDQSAGGSTSKFN